MYVEFSSSAFFTDDVEDCIVNVTGIIKNDEETKIGALEAYYLDIEMAITQNYDIFELYDAIINLTDYYAALYDADDHWFFKETVVDEFGGNVINANLLVIHKIEILPEYRGQKIGLAVIYKTIQQIGHGCGFIALMPAPLQFSLYKDNDRWQKTMNVSDFVQNETVAIKKLGIYYGKLGFRQIGDSGVYILNPALKQPDLITIGFE